MAVIQINKPVTYCMPPVVQVHRLNGPESDHIIACADEIINFENGLLGAAQFH